MMPIGFTFSQYRRSGVASSERVTAVATGHKCFFISSAAARAEIPGASFTSPAFGWSGEVPWKILMNVSRLVTIVAPATNPAPME